ncbi:hypothetical protein [Caballeronia sordidicola]|uniref:Uncharacterized protein n=1 Tax=Caballeronia sordidicola TaxID=196367 RepID=A0A242MZG5_CABSO|nr:hypothetical protein [Caballeronia sordidicola]OTP76524.1 hypothetical protein PAMC26577_10670 [Caballeronia sordidicola]
MPYDRAEQVVSSCEKIAAYGADIEAYIAGGLLIDDLIERLYGGMLAAASD